MTLEERAEEYAESIFHDIETSDDVFEKFKQAYIAGYNERESLESTAFAEGVYEGKKNATEWHFVKNGDFPLTNKDVLSDKHDIVYYDADDQCWVDTRTNIEIDNVDAWCELPPVPIEEV